MVGLWAWKVLVKLSWVKVVVADVPVLVAQNWVEGRERIHFWFDVTHSVDFLDLLLLVVLLLALLRNTKGAASYRLHISKFGSPRIGYQWKENGKSRRTEMDFDNRKGRQKRIRVLKGKGARPSTEKTPSCVGVGVGVGIYSREGVDLLVVTAYWLLHLKTMLWDYQNYKSTLQDIFNFFAPLRQYSQSGGELCGGSGEATAAREVVAAAKDNGFSKAFYFSPKSSFSLPALSSLPLSSLRVSLPSHRQQKQAVTTCRRSRYSSQV
ncbi:unnamed protein product [Ilex paraguariensis]|uniref:Uncharacterized protein n=1 Tax=Ilex paraguariensis TaxID=185542 RepID=A0ABC8TR35_9AQUA